MFFFFKLIWRAETKFDFNDKCHVYQTGIHRSDYLAAERIKREGDALFKLLMNAAADTMPSSVGMVYFDVFGWKMIHLDVSTASVIGYAITAASVFSMLIVTLTVDSGKRITLIISLFLVTKKINILFKNHPINPCGPIIN